MPIFAPKAIWSPYSDSPPVVIICLIDAPGKVFIELLPIWL